LAGRIGLILVHGIGEQKRFTHLDAEIRSVIAALQRRPSARITTEILSGSGSTYSAEQDTWAAGENPSARITVIEPDGITEINVHEVWWADVNEPYSLAKQVRFWLWGLSVWNFPSSKNRQDLAGFQQAMLVPETPGRTVLRGVLTRVQLFLAGMFFLVAAFSLGAVVFFAKRLLGLEPPDIVRVFVNYISGVKLYNQSTRQGAGFFPNRRDFLDTINDPPRVSIRRRIMQAIVAVAFRPNDRPYDRWYILGHSLGSIVSFNGIMENGQAFANYLARETWESLKLNGLAGTFQGVPGWARIPPGKMSPSRPVWVGDNELVYRERLFQNFRGLLTYGSPLGKFAELWPARVPVNKVEPIFQGNAEWINVFDGRDPVGGPLKAFEPANLALGGVTGRHCPPLRSFAYIASPVLLLAHIRYLTTREEAKPQLSDVVAEWLVTGNAFSPPPPGAGRWCTMNTYWQRIVVSWVWWIIASLVLAILGTITGKALLELFWKVGDSGVQWLKSFAGWLGP
jgi:hypothetical protein